MGKNRIIFHIGLPKTGTTFLQNNVFPYFKDINYIDCINPKKGYKEIHLNPFYLKVDNEKINLISDERITSLGYLNFPYIDIFEKIRILSQVFPTAEIIFVNRDKNSLIKSLYKQYGKYGYGVLNFDDWYNSEFDLSLLIIDEYLKFINSLFDKVLILNYEDLFRNQEEFIMNICDFIGISFPENYDKKSVHVSPSDSAINSIIKINNFRFLPHNIKSILRYFYRKNISNKLKIK
jgi:hypothetical protein